MSLRESLVEESAKEKEKEKNWETIAKRTLANLMFVLLLLGSAYLVIWVVGRSQEKTNSWYRQNEITIVMSLISMVMPVFFDVIALLEEYHPRKAMRWMLARIMALNLLRYWFRKHFIRYCLRVNCLSISLISTWHHFLFLVCTH